MVFHVISAPARYKSLEYSWHPAMPACCRACYVVLMFNESSGFCPFRQKNLFPAELQHPTLNQTDLTLAGARRQRFEKRITSTPGASTRATHPAAGYVHPHIRILGISTARARLEESAGGRKEVRPTVPAHRAHCFGDAIRFPPQLAPDTDSENLSVAAKTIPRRFCRHKGKRVPQMS